MEENKLTLFLVFRAKPEYEESFNSMNNSTFANRWNLDEIESNYQTWLNEPASLDSRWQIFFEGFHLGFEGNGYAPTSSEAHSSEVEVGDYSIEKHARLYGAIYAFRDIGHTQGTFDPLKDEVPSP